MTIYTENKLEILGNKTANRLATSTKNIMVPFPQKIPTLDFLPILHKTQKKPEPTIGRLFSLTSPPGMDPHPSPTLFGSWI